MSRVATLAAAGLLVALAAQPVSVPAADPAPPPLEALAPRFDAGRVEAGTTVRHTYVLRNRGTTTLQILAKPSCGCTTTDYDHTIAPGTTGKVDVALDTTYVHGPLEKTIAVMTNDPTQPTITLTLVADSGRALVVEPRDPPILQGPVRHVPPAVLTVHAFDDGAFRIDGVADDPSLRAAVAPLDEAVDGMHRRYRVTLTPAPELAVGSYHPSVVLTTTHPNAPRFDLGATIVVTGPLVVLPWELHVGHGVTTVAVRVTAGDGVPFRVLGAECTDPNFSATFAAVADEPAWNVVVRYSGPPTHHGPVNAVVKITTDAPTQPLVLVRLLGRV
jgi:hypothetical protein